jgi:hypothetical protein
MEGCDTLSISNPFVAASGLKRDDAIGQGARKKSHLPSLKGAD